MEIKDRRSLTSPANGKYGGVKTEVGKEISSQNSLKHGILSNYATELDDVHFDDAYQMFAEEFGDETTSRKTIISQVAILYIRLRRCARFESEFIREQINPPKYEQRLIKKGALAWDSNELADQYETVLVIPGNPMSLDLTKLEGLENLLTKYEPQILNHFCRLVKILTRSAN